MNNLADYNDFFLFVGGILLFSGIIYLFFRRILKNIFITDEEVSELKGFSPDSTVQISIPKISITAVLLVIIIGGFFINQFLMWKTGSSGGGTKPFSISINISEKNAK